MNDSELHGLGYIRTIDGKLLSNQDGFYDDHPDFLGTYDTRTMVAVSKSLLFKLLEVFENVGSVPK